MKKPQTKLRTQTAAVAILILTIFTICPGFAQDRFFEQPCTVSMGKNSTEVKLKIAQEIGTMNFYLLGVNSDIKALGALVPLSDQFKDIAELRAARSQEHPYVLPIFKDTDGPEPSSARSIINNHPYVVTTVRNQLELSRTWRQAYFNSYSLMDRVDHVQMTEQNGLKLAKWEIQFIDYFSNRKEKSDLFKFKTLDRDTSPSHKWSIIWTCR